jgi:hypothetical protein
LYSIQQLLIHNTNGANLCVSIFILRSIWIPNQTVMHDPNFNNFIVHLGLLLPSNAHVTCPADPLGTAIRKLS